MRMRAAHERGDERTGQHDIVDEPPLAGQQFRVLQPLHPRAELLGTHPPVSWSDAVRDV